MTDFARVLRNTGWFLLGNALPILAALLTVPLLIDLLGTTRFGLLTLAWTLVGYFSLFDLGLGRALTKMVAERSQVGPTESRTGGTTADLSTLCSTGLGMVIVLGAVGGVVGPLAILWSDSWFDGVDAGGEELRSVIWIALGIPLVVVTAALRGILEGFQEFRLLALIRAPTGAAMFVVPWLAASIQPTLDWAVAALVLTRLVVLIAHWVPCSRRLHLSLAGVQRRWVRPLVNFGGWLTVINVVGPIVTYADRFVIASMMAAATVAYYTVPFDVVARLMLFPLALSSALLPALSGARHHDPLGAQRLHRKVVGFTVALVFPGALLGALIAEPALRFWLGPEFAMEATRVTQILLFGFAAAAASQMTFSALQSHGNIRSSAILTLVQVVPYFVALVVLVRSHGIVGAAVAWTVRSILNWMVLVLILRVQEAGPLTTARTSTDDRAELR
jgi:O-antigen/teichoic acid export membrane protein